jgi:hypothetical protein
MALELRPKPENSVTLFLSPAHEYELTVRLRVVELANWNAPEDLARLSDEVVSVVAHMRDSGAANEPGKELWVELLGADPELVSLVADGLSRKVHPGSCPGQDNMLEIEASELERCRR